MPVSVRKDSEDQRMARLLVTLERENEERDLPSRHNMFRLFAGPTISVNHPDRERQAPEPDEVREYLHLFLDANNA